MTGRVTDDAGVSKQADSLVRWIIIGIEYAIVSSLLLEPARPDTTPGLSIVGAASDRNSGAQNRSG